MTESDQFPELSEVTPKVEEKLSDNNISISEGFYEHEIVKATMQVLEQEVTE
jgi:hypothetical protein